MWEWIINNLVWIVLGAFAIGFLLKDVPKLIQILKKTNKYGDTDPSGNDNVSRKPYDYM